MKYLISILLIFSYSLIHAQEMKYFEQDFHKALNPDFSVDELNQFFRIYPTLLTPHSDITNLAANLEDKQVMRYPLFEFKKTDLYRENIDKLLSGNYSQRIYAYLLIAASCDTTFEDTLYERIKTEKEKGALLWAGMALLHMQSDRTTELFDFLVKNEDFGDAHMLPLFISLNPDSLQNTAYARFDSDNILAKILSVQIFSVTGLNSKTDSLLRKAVKEWDFNIKGYALYSIMQLKMGNLRELAKPLLDSTQTRAIALMAIANSPEYEDLKFLKSLAQERDSVSEEILNCFFYSSNEENVKYFLKLLCTKKIPADFYFNINEQPLLMTDNVFPDLISTINKVTEPNITYILIQALEGREDDKSMDIMMANLLNKDETVRYWTANTLKGCKSARLKDLLPKYISNPELITGSLVDLAIENNIDTLHQVIDSYLNKNPDGDDYRFALNYISSFPLQKYTELFRAILQDDKDDFDYKKNLAAFGLAKLHDYESVDLIIKCSRKQGDVSDLNVREFLKALSVMKGDKAKEEIEKYKNSDEDIVRELAENLLKNW